MQMLSLCPVCRDPLLNEYLGVYIVKQLCAKRLDHWIELKWSGKVQEMDLYQITICVSNDPRTMAIWYPQSAEFHVHIETAKRPLTVPNISLPFFFPDLSDYERLVEKIKMCLIFA